MQLAARNDHSEPLHSSSSGHALDLPMLSQPSGRFAMCVLPECFRHYRDSRRSATQASLEGPLVFNDLHIRSLLGGIVHLLRDQLHGQLLPRLRPRGRAKEGVVRLDDFREREGADGRRVCLV